METTEVTAALIWEKGRVLIAKRAAQDRLINKWEFPGGKTEYGESPEECLKREILEELGIVIEVGEFFAESIYAYPEGPIRLLSYFAFWKSGEVNPEVHEEIKWVEPNELQEYDLAPADIPIAEKLASVETVETVFPIKQRITE